jgi:hypothetical protein
MEKQKTHFETVPLVEVPDVVVLREPGGVETVSQKSEPYAVEVEWTRCSGEDNSFRRRAERRR